jgi:hypothetical protein
VVVENLRVPGVLSAACITIGLIDSHHDLPCVYWKISIIEGPIKLLFCNWLVRRVMVGGEIWVSESLLSSYTFLRVKYQHGFEQFHSYISLVTMNYADHGSAYLVAQHS